MDKKLKKKMCDKLQGKDSDVCIHCGRNLKTVISSDNFARDGYQYKIEHKYCNNGHHFYQFHPLGKVKAKKKGRIIEAFRK